MPTPPHRHGLTLVEVISRTAISHDQISLYMLSHEGGSQHWGGAQVDMCLSGRGRIAHKGRGFHILYIPKSR